MDWINNASITGADSLISNFHTGVSSIAILHLPLSFLLSFPLLFVLCLLCPVINAKFCDILQNLQLSANPIILFKLASFYHTGHKVSILCILFPNTKSQKRLQPIDSGWSLNDYNFFCFLTVSTTVLPFIFTNVILYYYFITILIRLVYRNTILLYQYIALIYSYSLINSYSTA